MLQLMTRNREFSQILNNTRYIDRMNNRNVRGVGYIYEKTVGDIHLPFVFNNIDVMHSTFGVNMIDLGVPDRTDIDTLAANITGLYENCNEDKVMVLLSLLQINIVKDMLDFMDKGFVLEQAFETTP